MRTCYCGGIQVGNFARQILVRVRYFNPSWRAHENYAQSDFGSFQRKPQCGDSVLRGRCPCLSTSSRRVSSASRISARPDARRSRNEIHYGGNSMSKLWKPMLAPNEVPSDDFIATRLPLLASYKLDGIRCTVQGGQLLSRSLKPIPNKFLQERFSSLPEGTDGELVQGIKQDNETFKRSHKIVMKSDRPLDFFGDTVRLHVFDRFHPEIGFRFRMLDVDQNIGRQFDHAIPIKQVFVATMNDLAAFEKLALGLGYEGVMLRSLDGPYKQGRATLNQGWLMKL